jgi:hypothetical protein
MQRKIGLVCLAVMAMGLALAGCNSSSSESTAPPPAPGGPGGPGGMAPQQGQAPGMAAPGGQPSTGATGQPTTAPAPTLQKEGG